MTSFRNLVIGTWIMLGIGLLLVALLPEYSMFSSVGKILVVVGIFANVYLAFSLVSCGIMGVRA